MMRLSYEQQIDALSKILENEIIALKTLPKKEAQLRAHNNLVNAGIIDKDGKLTNPYVALGNHLVQ